VTRRATGVTPLRTLAFCALKWTFLTILSAGLLFAAGLFTEELTTLALTVLGLYGVMLVGALAGKSCRRAWRSLPLGRLERHRAPDSWR
jgi:hypothetical protein